MSTDKKDNCAVEDISLIAVDVNIDQSPPGAF